MTRPTTETAPNRRNLILVAGVIALAIVAGLLIAQLNAGETTSGADDPEPTASETPSLAPSAPASPSQPTTPSATPDQRPVAAPDEWTQVHTIGDGSMRIVGGQIAWGDAGFIAVARTYEGGEGGPRATGFTLWRSADGQTWTEVSPPVADEGGLNPVALTGAPDGGYVLHAQNFDISPSGFSIFSFHSTDGEAWEPLETGLPRDVAIQAIEEGPAGYLLVGGQTSVTNPSLWLSSDALTWELVHEFSQDEQFVQLHDGDGGAEGYVVIGRRIEPDSSSYQRFAFASADGREWIEQPQPFGPDDQDFIFEVGISSRGDGWLATIGNRDETTSLWASDDGLTWSEAGTLDARNLTTSSPGLFEEIGSEILLSPGASMGWEGTPGVYSSTDGTTWTPIDLGADTWVGDVTVGDGVVAMTGTIPGTGDDFTSTGAIWIRASD